MVIGILALSIGQGFADICTCKDAQLRGGWCDACRVGYVAAVRITSADLFEALDAHGHDFDAGRIACPSCQAAIKSNGFCETSQMGFVKGQAYLSRLAYHLAAGELTKRETLTCVVCHALAGKSGWCGNCKKGWIGYVAIRNEDDYRKAFTAYGILVDAVETLTRCETCAIAKVTNARCLTCKIKYQDGKPVDGTSPRSESGIIETSNCNSDRFGEVSDPE